MNAKDELIKIRHKLLKGVDDKDDMTIKFAINNLDTFIYKNRVELENLNKQ